MDAQRAKKKHPISPLFDCITFVAAAIYRQVLLARHAECLPALAFVVSMTCFLQQRRRQKWIGTWYGASGFSGCTSSPGCRGTSL